MLYFIFIFIVFLFYFILFQLGLRPKLNLGPRPIFVVYLEPEQWPGIGPTKIRPAQPTRPNKPGLFARSPAWSFLQAFTTLTRAKLYNPRAWPFPN